MADIIEFKKKETEEPPTVEVLQLSMTQTHDGQYEMYLEISEQFSDLEIYIALESAAAKFGLENNFIEMDYTDDFDNEPDTTD